MSTRRSGRAKAPVKYTSDSEESDFGAKKRKTPATKKKAEQAAPKKATKRGADADVEPTTTTPAPKRRKKNPQVLAAELREKAKIQEDKAQKSQHKIAWEDWQNQHDVDGKLLDAEPDREELITQTDSLKKYGLKPKELGSLLHFEKRHPTYNNTVKLFKEKDVKELALRKYGILAGETKEAAILKKGEELWKAEHADDADDANDSPEISKSKQEKGRKDKTPKQKWKDYIASHALPDNDERYLAEEPDASINQTESKGKYHVTPAELGVLPYFKKKKVAYGGVVKLFSEKEVEGLASRKVAVLEGLDEDTEGGEGKE